MKTAERRLAENISRVHARDLVDDYCNGVTVGGNQLGDAYLKRFAKLDFNDAWDCHMALKHWVQSAGYGKDGMFIVVLSDTIQNC